MTTIPSRSGLHLFTGAAVLALTSILTACGGGGGGGGGGGESAPEPSLALFAGDLDGPGSADGTGADARFNVPRSVATDSAGNVYVADGNNHTIRHITPAGVVTTFAGTAGLAGSSDATGADARFNFPRAVATDSAGNVYVADTSNHTIRHITPLGVVTTLAGTAGFRGSADGTGADARFNVPRSVATDSAGNVYVADGNNHTIRHITPAGVVTTFAGTAGAVGSAEGTGADARFNFPRAVATDSAGNVYVADSSNHTIRQITPAGVVTTLAGTAGAFGSADGTGADARFFTPSGVATDSAGNVYVADRINHTIRHITPAGVVSTFAGTAGAAGSTDATGADARFNRPQSVATDSAGNVYVADGNNHTIRHITPAGVVTTLAGTAGAAGSANGTGADARFNSLRAVATDSAGNVYVADSSNHTIRQITPAGAVSTIVGQAAPGFVAGALPGGLVNPQGVTIHGTSLYITLVNGVAVVANRP